MEQHTHTKPQSTPTAENITNAQPQKDKATAAAPPWSPHANIQPNAATYNMAEPSTAHNTHVAPTQRSEAPYRPPAARHAEKWRQLPGWPHQHNNKNQPTTALVAPITNSDQVHSTYASALSTPNILLDAGKKQNQGKQRADAKLMDPRNAIKNKKNQANLSLTSGWVLMNNIQKNCKWSSQTGI